MDLDLGSTLQQQQQNLLQLGLKEIVYIHILSGHVTEQWDLKATKRLRRIRKPEPSRIC